MKKEQTEEECKEEKKLFLPYAKNASENVYNHVFNHEIREWSSAPRRCTSMMHSPLVTCPNPSRRAPPMREIIHSRSGAVHGVDGWPSPSLLSSRYILLLLLLLLLCLFFLLFLHLVHLFHHLLGAVRSSFSLP